MITTMIFPITPLVPLTILPTIFPISALVPNFLPPSKTLKKFSSVSKKILLYKRNLSFCWSFRIFFSPILHGWNILCWRVSLKSSSRMLLHSTMYTYNASLRRDYLKTKTLFTMKNRICLISFLSIFLWIFVLRKRNTSFRW